MAGGEINLVDYNSTTAFWSFLIYCLVVIFVAVFFLFYASRIFAQVLSKLIRWITWHRLKAYIEIESLQIAPLGGRILFKNVRYHSRNQSITILHGYITFRYWLWNVRTEDDPIPEDSAGITRENGAAPGSDSPAGVGAGTGTSPRDADKDNCRITCNLVGLEWFMYNRTPAYDVLAATLGLNPDASPLEAVHEDNNPRVAVNMENVSQDNDSDDSWFRRCLPVKIVCDTGAIIMGNAHLQSLLVASFPVAHGMYSATKSRSSLDKYKTVLHVTFETPTIDFRPNADYNTALVGRNTAMDVPDISRLPPSKPTRFQKFKRLVSGLWAKYVGIGATRKEAEEWHGLPRYNQNASFDNLKDNKFHDYAMVRNVLQCNSLGMRYSTDVAGKVPEPSLYGQQTDYDLPPEWSLDLIIDDGVLSYGPWADRQRAEMQNFFFPNAYRHLEPTHEPQPGEDRVHAALQIMVTFSSSVTIKIPTQEKSKDWKYNDLDFQAVQAGKSARPFGWLELKALNGSMISVDIPMVYGPEGYRNVVLVELQGPTVTSSVNYAPVINLKELKIVCQLNNPLEWNAQRDWDFEFTLDTPEMFLLRDHITLIQDLSKDWTSGPPVEMPYFVPFKYEFDIKMPNFNVYTYVNEHNIINEPTEIDENASGQTLDCKVVLPFLQFSPELTTISFDVDIQNGGLKLQLPLAHTLGEFTTPDSQKFADIPSLAIKGNYNYYDFVDPSHVESLNLDVKGQGVTVKLFGNVIRYVLILMDNYAGLYINFVTMEEYRQTRDNIARTQRDERRQVISKPPSDPFEVYVRFSVTDITLQLPENLYKGDNYSEISCAEIQLDLRNLDLYMDMHVNISPLTWRRKTIKDPAIPGLRGNRSDQNYLYIDGISIYAHRLFGPLPKTTTYVANWKLDIGSIYGQIKPSFILSVGSFAKAFAYNLVDGDNAFPPEYATVTPPDITFVDLCVKEVDVSIWGEDVVSQVLLKDGVIVHFDDVINEKYLARVVLKLQSLLVRSMALTDVHRDGYANEADMSQHDSAPWVEIASLNCAFDVTVYQGAGNWKERREKQQSFVREQDRETLRCPHIYTRTGSGEGARLPRHPKLKGNHFGTIHVPPLTSDTAAYQASMRPTSIRSASSVVEVPSENGSMFEYMSSTNSILESKGPTVRRSLSSFSMGFSPVGDQDGDEDDADQEPGLQNWDDMDSDGPDTDFSSDELSENDYDEYHELPPDVSDQEPKNAPSFPVRSIPYSSYLKRHKVSTSHPAFNRNPYLPPPRVLFSQTETGDILDDAPRRHPRANFFEAFGVNDDQTSSIPSAQPSGNDNPDEKRTTIVVESTQDVKILLTPILLKIIQEFLEAINAEEWDLETMLDVTQMEYVELLTRMQPSKMHSQQFLIYIPRIHLRFIQDVMMPDTMNGGDEISMIKTRYELSSANLCAIDVVLDNASVIAAVKYEDEEFKKYVPGKIHIASFKVVESRANVDFSKFKLNSRFVSTSTARIFGIPDARHQFSKLRISHLSYLNEPVIADISFEQFSLRLMRSTTPNHFSVNLEKLAVMFINQSAEIVAGSLCSWLTFVKDLKTILKRFQLRRSKQLQTLFSEIARFSDQKAINSDPVFLTIPSTTLRLGTLFCRSDDGWKLLAHIRHCMRLMPPTITSALQESLKKPELEHFSTETMYDIVIDVFSKWRNWEMDDLRHCRLFSDVFERRQTSESDSMAPKKESLLYEVLRYSANSVQLNLGEFEATIYDEQMENKMRLAGLEFIFESRYKLDTLVQEGINSGDPAAKETSRLSSGFLDVAVKTGFKSAEVDVNPVIIAFTRHILRVERIFRPQFNKVMDPPNSSSPRQSFQISRETTAVVQAEKDTPLMKTLERFDIVFNGMAVIETIRITMTAHNLSAQVIFSQIQASALNFAKQRAFLNQDTEITSVAKSSNSNPDGSTAGRSGINKLIASLATNISSINSSLKERVYTKDNGSSISMKELLTFGIVGINTEVALSQFTPSKRPKQTKASVPREVIHLLVTFKQVNIALPRSILKLYLFAKDWREENMQSFDFLFQGVMNEWEADRTQQPKTITPSTPRELKVQVVLKTLTLESHLLPSLLFQYEAGDLMVVLHDVPPGLPLSVPQLTYTVQLMRQTVDFVANQSSPRPGDPPPSSFTDGSTTASFSLPMIRATGSVMNVLDSSTVARTRRTSISALTRGVRQPKKLESSVSFDFIEMKLNVNILDHILTAQSLLGAEANELIDILSKGAKSTPTLSSPSAQMASSPEMLYSVKVTLDGLQIAAASPSAVLYFESDQLQGIITNNPAPQPTSALKSEPVQSKLAWRLYAQNITLSLNHAGGIHVESRAENRRARKLRQAYITINLNVQNFNPNTTDEHRFAQTPVSTFYVSFLKVHALMQPQSVSRIIGLYSYYTHELDRRKELKASDMAKLADNTKRIIKSLDVEVPAYKDNTRSMLEATEIYLTIDDVAVAIPLDRREDIMDNSERQVEAFLISATSISVLTKSGETSSGTLSHLSAQFVPKFDQSRDEHFRSRSHPKMNRMSFPNISAQVESTKDSPSQQSILSKATVSGFELDIDPTIVRYLNTLSDVYDNSKVLVTSMNVEQANAPPLSTGRSDGSLHAPKSQPSSPFSTTVIWKIENTFQCSKSICRFYPKSYVAKLPRSSKFMESEPNFPHVGADASGVDRFVIPGLSLWTSLHIPLGDNPAEVQAAGPPKIHAEINIHSCENTFYPSLVPFFQDIVSGLKVGIRRQRQYSEPEILVAAPLTAPSEPTAETVPEASAVSTELQQVSTKRQELSVTCYFCIEKTKIEFNCQPMAKVMSVLTVEQGNILMSYNSDTDGNTSSTVAGTFGGASSDTRHIFSQDKGFKLETKGMIFNAVAETRRRAEQNKKTLSLAIDFRRIVVDIDLRQAEILVLMKMIWMDQANYLIRDGLTVSRSTSSSQGFEPSLSSNSIGGNANGPGTGGVIATGKRESSFLGYNIFAVARLRQMKIVGDLGSQIGKMDFALDEVCLRTKLRPFHPRSLSVTIGPLDLQFLPMERGWLEGYLKMGGISLETLSKVNRHPEFPCSVMEVVLQTHRMTSMLSYDYKKFLILAVEPTRVVLQDHWNGPNIEHDVSQAIIARLQGLRLLAGAKTVPVFKTLLSRLTGTLEQKQSAAESEFKKALKHASTLRPTVQETTAAGPLTPTSEKSSISLKNRIQAAWGAVGRVQVTVGNLDLSLFPYFLTDKECTHACVQGVKVKLDRYMIYADSEPPVIHRLTGINMGQLSLQKYILQVIDQSTANSFTLEQWFDRIRSPSSATIARLPATSQMMESWQVLDSMVIEHICKTQFEGLIDIATDYRLFRGVEKNFQRFLEEMSIKSYRNESILGDTGTTETEPSNPQDESTAAVLTGEELGTKNGLKGPGGQPLSRVNSNEAGGAGLEVMIPEPRTSGAAANDRSQESKSTQGSNLALTTTTSPGIKNGFLGLTQSSPVQSTEETTSSSGPLNAVSPVSSLKSPLSLFSSLSPDSSSSSPGVTGSINGINGSETRESNGTLPTETAVTATSLNEAKAGQQKQQGQVGEEAPPTQLLFQAREQIVFKPALDVLPNTPLPLGQLGFKKEDIPPIVHMVTTGLETGLLAVAEFHAKKVEMSGLQDIWEGRVEDDEEM
ncbi:hypothetical protein BGW38_007796 [Lunasporangiospora selenospora]|uniref:Csf1 N-terminal domain-containing protein n=1 Tax=Lunasporangiospora selenospora TaxID=979761 RepID=A0A9P6G383_9FUNG|nr:hypothetical protein BGW38_007796 [Lunasporangiospora selenospora]